MNSKQIKYIEYFKIKCNACERWEDILLTEYRKNKKENIKYILSNVELNDIIKYLVK